MHNQPGLDLSQSTGPLADAERAAVIVELARLQRLLRAVQAEMLKYLHERNEAQAELRELKKEMRGR